MRYIILTLLILAGLTLGIQRVYSARFDFVLGEPTITDDNDNTTNGVRYDFVLGEPAVVWAEPTPVAVVPPDLRVDKGRIDTNNGRWKVK